MTEPVRPEEPEPSEPARPALARRVGLAGAVGIGLASMIGAGVFFVWGPAAAAAGELLLVALALAVVVATLNAFSSAQLAMAHPVAGGAYAFGRRWVGERTGFAAGWLFVTGKTASAAAIASIAAAYLGTMLGAAGFGVRLIAVGLLVLFAAINMTGVRATARVSMTIAAIVIAGLTTWLIAVALGVGAGARAGADSSAGGGAGVDVAALAGDPGGPVGVLQAAALLFFAFAGYARMATLGEEVVAPRRTLPRAILAALAVALALYAAVAIALVSTLGVDRLARAASPLAEAADPAWVPVIAALAVLASLGSLVGILSGLSRTSLAMARERDLPSLLARISARTRAPIVAEAVIASAAIAIVLLLDPAQLVAASSAAVLVYYAIAHLAALRQEAALRWQPRFVAVAGLIGCLALAAALPWSSLLGTAALLAVGFALRGLALRARRGPGS